MRTAYYLKLYVTEDMHYYVDGYVVIHEHNREAHQGNNRYDDSHHSPGQPYPSRMVTLDTMAEALALIRELIPFYEKRLSIRTKPFEIKVHPVYMV